MGTSFRVAVMAGNPELHLPQLIDLQVLFDLLDVVYSIYFSVKLPIQLRVNCDLRDCITGKGNTQFKLFALDQYILIDNVVFWIHVVFFFNF